MLKDGVVLEDSGDRIVVNQYSFCELIKHLLTHYVGISYENASRIVTQSHISEPISSVMDAVLGYESLLWRNVLEKRNICTTR